MKMKINKRKLLTLTILLIVINAFVGVIVGISYYSKINYRLNVTSDTSDEIQIFQTQKQNVFDENTSLHFKGINKKTPTLIGTEISTSIKYIRIDFNDTKHSVNKITDFDVYKGNNHQNSMKYIEKNLVLHNCIVQAGDNILTVKSTGKDPYMIIKMDKSYYLGILNNNKRLLLSEILLVLILVNILLCFVYFLAKRSNMCKDIYRNKKLIWSLSINDFRTKYAGSFFGVLWAFVQPVVTIALYWFVFQIGLRSGDVGNVPFVLWLMCGLVPWFFFQDAIMAVTNSLIEYSFLVKKMVFQIEILPLVKIVSNLFINLFFIAFMLVTFCLMGYYPSVYAIQIVYYTFCSIVLVLGIGFATSALVIFFKDLSQIIQIVLQIGMWMTPILWNVQMIPSQFLWLIELNPMYYIVTGFRDSLIDHIWFWNRVDLMINFWLITLSLYVFGIFIYKKLRCHFADVL